MKLVTFNLVLLACVLLIIIISMTLIWTCTQWRPYFIVHICHDIMLWHEPDRDNGYEFDGCSLHAKCKWCGKDIMQDSQGNWF